MALLTGRKALLIYTGRKDGLGNRIRALLSAKALAEAEERDLFYVWSTDEFFGPRMDELWRFEAGRPVSRLMSRAVAIAFPFRDTDLTNISDDDRASHLWQIRSGGVEVSTPSGVRDWRTEFRELEPVPEIAGRVHEVFDDHLRGRPYVGVQVRTHTVSHAKTVATSPVEWFAQRMRSIRASHPDVPFFLSCDTEESQERLQAEFSNCVALVDKGGYNTVDGVRSSIADLYLLGSSQHLIGAAYSSFVEMAVFLSDGVVPFERPNRPLEGELDLSLAYAADPLHPAQRG